MYVWFHKEAGMEKLLRQEVREGTVNKAILNQKIRRNGKNKKIPVSYEFKASVWSARRSQ